MKVGAALSQWLAARWAVDRVEVTDVVRRTEGFSWQTYTAQARWVDRADVGHRRGVVVRRQPEAGLLAPYDVVAQYRLHEALLGAGLPVPGLIGLETSPDVLGMPFYAMNLVDGLVPVQWQGDDPAIFPDDAARRRIGLDFVDALAAIHDLDWAAAHLDAVLPGPGDVDPGTAEIERWERFLDDAVIVEVPLLRVGLAWCRRHVATSDRVAVCHGDYRIGNFMVRDGRLVAVFDWELSHLGDPVEDVAWANLRLFRGRSDLVSQLLPLDEVRRRYAERTGLVIDEDVLRFWTILGMIKAAAPHVRAAATFERDGSHDLRLAAMGHQCLHVLGHLAGELERAS